MSQSNKKRSNAISQTQQAETLKDKKISVSNVTACSVTIPVNMICIHLYTQFKIGFMPSLNTSATSHKLTNQHPMKGRDKKENLREDSL